MRRVVPFAAAAVLLGCAFSLLRAQNPAAGNTGPEYKALTRFEVEELAPGGRPSGVPSNRSADLTAGLNVLAADGWELAGIEPYHESDVGGGGKYLFQVTYVFRRGR